MLKFRTKIGGLSQGISIRTSNWDDMNINFLVDLPHTLQKHDFISVILDQMMKLAHFIPIKVSYSAEDL